MFLASIQRLNAVVWDFVMLPLLIGIGVFLTVRLKFFQFTRSGSFFRLTIGKIFVKQNQIQSKNFNVWETVSTALASTIGTGSIFGVAFAVKAGGAGTVFWMWISAILGMAIKYSEIVLAVHYQENDREGFRFGGPMVYLRSGVGSNFLAIIFAFFCLCVSFCMGNCVQSNAITSSVYNQTGVSPMISGIVLTLLVSVVILGGAKKIAAFNSKLVPFMSVLYIACCVIILFIRHRVLSDVFQAIFLEAFSFNAFAGGVSSYGILVAMKNGFAKGIFSNEAGLGSAAIAHASTDTADEAEQGAWGVFEVFFTTLVICTLTALVVLSTDPEVVKNSSISDLTFYSFESSLPFLGGFCVTASTVLFSLSTILGWAFYGEVCLRFLFKNFRKYCTLYRILYVFVVFFGSVGSLEFIWTISEFMNALMAIPNLIGIMILSGKVVQIYEKS